MSKRRFYLPPESVSRESVIVGSDALHIIRVLRMTAGEYIGIFDGTGNQYTAEITCISNATVQVRVIDNFGSNRESPLSLTLAQSFLKDKKMNVLIRQLTELGLDRWIPFISNRSVSIPNEKRLALRVKKWRRISIEAAKQCRRGVLPRITFLRNFEDVLALSKFHDISVIFWEGNSCNLTTSGPMDFKIRDVMIVVGPEGGFDISEIEAAKNSEFMLASLGPRILRAETASVAACSIIQYLFGDMRQKNLTF